MIALEQNTESQALVNRHMIVTHIERVGRGEAANVLGCDLSYVANLVNDESSAKLKFANIGKLLAQCGLKVVPSHHTIYDPAYIRFLEYGCGQFAAMKGMTTLNGGDVLNNEHSN